MTNQRIHLAGTGATEGSERLKSLNDFLKLHDPILLDYPEENNGVFTASDKVEYNDKFVNGHGYDNGLDGNVYDAVNPDVDAWAQQARADSMARLMDMWQHGFESHRAQNAIKQSD